MEDVVRAAKAVRRRISLEAMGGWWCNLLVM